jgi:hypothetical protein
MPSTFPNQLVIKYNAELSTVISISTRIRAGRPEFDYRQRQGYFLFATACRPTLGPTLIPIQWVAGVKRLECEADHSPPSSAEVNNAWSYTSSDPLPLHGAVLTSGLG